MKKILLIVTTMLLLLLCGCSNDGLNGTYWRNEKTGEWLMGIADGLVVYDCQYWNITSQTEEEDAYTIEAENGKEKLVVNIGKEENDLRTISINGKEATCSYINSYCLPDYPEKDETPLANNNYQEGDSVTIVGWIRKRPMVIDWLKNQISNQEETKDVSVQITNIYNGQKQTFTAPFDSIGRFTLRMPIANTTSFLIDLVEDYAWVVAEPNETYFVMIDPIEEKKLFMGKNARLQNEVNAHRINPTYYGGPGLEEKGDINNALKLIKDETKKNMQDFEQICKEHPTLSEKYKTFFMNYLLTVNAGSLMQGQYMMSDYLLPEDYLKTVDEQYWAKLQEPYTLNPSEFSSFFSDYCMNIEMVLNDKNCYQIQWIMNKAERDGIIKLSARDRAAIKQCDAAYPAHREKWKNATDSLRKALEEEFDKNDFMITINEIISREGYDDYSFWQFTKRDFEQSLQEMEDRSWSQSARDLYLCRTLCKIFEWRRTPLDKSILDYADATIQIPAARKVVHELNEKYEAIGQCQLEEDNLKSNEVVKDMSEGEQILKKLIEPYKGKIILLDIWGTWCGPCKERLSHSQKEYERLKDYEMVYMYLANHSSEESWKNVIKEYHVMGENVIHYNLPDEQQKAVEDYLGVHAFPTYKLFDQQGHLLDVNADPTDLDALEKLIKRMSKK